MLLLILKHISKRKQVLLHRINVINNTKSLNDNNSTHFVNNDGASILVILLILILTLLDHIHNNYNKKYIDRVWLMLPELSKCNNNDNIDCSISNNESILILLSKCIYSNEEDRDDKNRINIHAPVTRFIHCISNNIDESVLNLLLNQSSYIKHDDNNTTSVLILKRINKRSNKHDASFEILQPLTELIIKHQEGKEDDKRNVISIFLIDGGGVFIGSIIKTIDL